MIPLGISATMFIGPPIFPVFNDHLPLSDELIDLDNDVVAFVRSDNKDMNFCSNASWSSDCEWYFVILPDDGIALFNVYSRNGLLCCRHSWRFIGFCVESGLLSRSIRRRRKRSLSSGQGPAA